MVHGRFQRQHTFGSITDNRSQVPSDSFGFVWLFSFRLSIASRYAPLEARLHAVQCSIDSWRNGRNLSAQFLLDAEQVKSIVVSDKVDCKTKMSVAPGASDSVQIGLGVFREIEINDNINALNVNPSCEKI